MTSVEFAHVYILDDAVDGRERRSAERPVFEQLLGVCAIYGRDPAAEPAAWRQAITRPAELEPIAVRVIA